MTPHERALFVAGIHRLAIDRHRERFTLGGICLLLFLVLGTNGFELPRAIVSVCAFLATILASWRLATMPSTQHPSELVDDNGNLTGDFE